MMRSLFAGVSALRYHQVRMDVIGNNIANVNTIGYKGSRVTFQELLSQTIRDASAPQAGRGGLNPMQVGLGVNLGTIATYHTQGTPQATGVTTDLAIQGDGFFILSHGNERFYTRAGMFDIDRDGNVVSLATGYRVMGWVADGRGNIDTNATVTEITIPKGATIDPAATTEIVLEGNLDARDSGRLSYSPSTVDITVDGETTQVTFTLIPTGNFNEFEWRVTATEGTWNAGDPPSGTIRLDDEGKVVASSGVATFELDFNGTTITFDAPTQGETAGGNFTWSGNNNSVTGEAKGVFQPAEATVTTIAVFDSLGSTHDVAIHFQKIDDNRWKWWAEDEAGNELADSDGEIVFDAQGRVLTASGTITIPGVGGASPIQITPSFAGLTQFGEAATATAVSQNGYGAGVLTSIGIDANGVIVGSFSNGLDRNLAQIATATFANPSGLLKAGDTLFRISTNSGPALVGVPGTGSRGSISSGTLEMSNVDLSQEFTDMIVTQRGFQANSRIITTSDEMLQELVNLKR